MLTKKIRGILVEKTEKHFEDGGKGYFCQMISEDDQIVSFWAPSGIGELLTEKSVEKYEEGEAETFVLRRRVFGGQEKLSLVEVY